MRCSNRLFIPAVCATIVVACGDGESGERPSIGSGGTAMADSGAGTGGATVDDSGAGTGGAAGGGSGGTGGIGGAPVDPCAGTPESVYCRTVAGPSFTDEPVIEQVIADLHGAGGGMAWLDYDNDGDLDLYVSNGVPAAFLGTLMPEGAFWRNNGDGTFTNVIDATGIAKVYKSGAALAGDIDNDGFVDLFITGGGGAVTPDGTQPPPRLYRNAGNGTFEDISATAGITGPPSAISSTFGDIDNDGDLDLYIAAFSNGPLRRADSGELYLNNGDRTFTEIGAAAGVRSALGGCAATMSHYDDDGLIDLFVANCADVNGIPTPLEVYKNDGDNTFTAVHETSGISELGYWMAVTHADIDNDGDLDLFSTSNGTIGWGPTSDVAIPPTGDGLVENLWHGLWRNEGAGNYTNIADLAGVARYEFAWGGSFADFDNDGREDLFFTGAFSTGNPATERIGPGEANPGRLLMNRGDGTFGRISPELPVDLTTSHTWGVTTVDYDNDGFKDIFVTSITTPDTSTGHVTVLHNSGNANHSVTIDLEGTTSNRDGVGALVTVRVGGTQNVKSLAAGSSFASSEGPWLIFGLGEATVADEVEVKWPSGIVEFWTNVATSGAQTLTEGTGTAR